MSSLTYRVSGLHCAACELLIEKDLLTIAGIKAVDVSLASGTVMLSGKHKAFPSVAELNTRFADDGYTFAELGADAPTSTQSPILYTLADKPGLKVDWKELWTRYRSWWLLLIVVVLFRAVLSTDVLGRVSVSAESALSIFFVFGLLAGLSSCAALIGGVLLSLGKSWADAMPAAATVAERRRPHVRFHLGRLVALSVSGGILGMFGSFLPEQNLFLTSLLIIIVSAVMLVVGLSQLGVRAAAKLQLSLPTSLSRKLFATGDAVSSHTPFWLGAATLLLPCGFTLAAQGVALASGSFVRGALVMLLFALGTALPLVAISLLGVNASQAPHRRRLISQITGSLLVVFAIYTIVAQWNVLGLPTVGDVFSQPAADATAVETVGGVQELKLIASGLDYLADGSLTLTAGVETTLVVDNQGSLGCAQFMASRGLIPGVVQLNPGENRIALGKVDKGTYKVTCSMGMVRPVTVVVR